MTFVDCFAAAVSADRKQEYVTHVEKAAAAFTGAGAEGVHECWGVDVPDGELTSFPLAVKAEPGEVVVIGWVIWPSKEARDVGMPKAMAALQEMGEHMPFDGKRLIFGGFETIYTG